MTDYTARNVLLKDSSGNYLIPYTEKADLSLGNLNSAGKAYVAIKGYDSTATYSLNEVVMTVVSGSVLLYRSLVDNNTSSLSDTTKWEEVELGGGSDIDNSTITLNSDDEIQTVGVIDNRSGSALKLWTGTRSQYDAIQNKDANTLYNITDDTGDLGTFANTDLSNLSNTGEAHFANPDMSNLSTTGQAVIDGKADVDAGNFDATGKSVLSGFPMPHSAEQLTLLASGGTYTAPSNGWFGVDAATNGGAWVKLASNVTGINDFYRNYSSGGTDATCLLLPVAKGQVVTYTYGGSFYNNYNHIYFIKAQGEN